MTTQIAELGVYSMSAEDYHADPVEGGSLSSTGARTLVNECPARFAWLRANPERKNVFDIGTAGHLLVLEPHLFDEKIVVVQGFTKKGEESPGYTTQDAKDQRAAAYAAGKTPLLKPEVEMVSAMRDALFEHPIAKHAFSGGSSEQALFWRDPEFDIWCRTRPDYLPPHRRYLVDYKTAASANPRDFERAMLNLGYHQQAAWYLDGVAAVTGEMPERFAFVVQEKTPPYCISVCWVDPEAIEIGRALNRFAKGLFAECQRSGTWPGYEAPAAQDPRAVVVNLPGWARSDFYRRQELGEFNPPAVAMEQQAA